ncbi:hypothetical protein HDU76_000812, partial [Blyttiomyces sp. JEL0837]
MESSYVARFVRDLITDEKRSEAMRFELGSGLAYCEEKYLATVLIDISGYSKVTSMLTKLGKVSSEYITQTVVGYLSKIIDVIARYDGDIVKFLGDAVLVTFESANEKQSSEESVVLRAMFCCLQILNECSQCDVALHEIGAMEIGGRRQSFSTRQLLALDKSTLFLHIAMTAGPTARVIMGIPSERLDYSISGENLSVLGNIMDNTMPGQLGIDSSVWPYIFPVESPMPPRISSEVTFETGFVKCSKLGCSAIWNFFQQNYDDNYWKGRSTETLHHEAGEEYESSNILGRFVNQSIWKKMMKFKDSLPSLASSKKSGYDNGSDSTVTDMGGEFRTVTVTFVKLSFAFERRTSQLAMTGLLKALKKYEGVFQQFSGKANSKHEITSFAHGLIRINSTTSLQPPILNTKQVDDKGQTMLAVFGLPPLSHPNDPDNATKAMIEFQEFAEMHFAGKMSIGIATGDILFTSMGTSYRREASLLGDVVNIAARLMILKGHETDIIVDEPTHNATRYLYQHDDIGLHRVKGKQFALQLWRIKRLQYTRSEATEFPICGYDEERSNILKNYLNWKNLRTRSVIFIEAASGLGKSTLGDVVSGMAVKDSISICLVQGTELEHRTPYAGIYGLVMLIFNHYLNILKSGNEERHRSRHSSDSWSTLQTNSRHSSRESQDFDDVRARERRSQDVWQLLTYYGEDPGYAPLFKLAIPWLKMGDTPKTMRLDPQAKNNILKLMILRLYQSFISKHQCVFIFDDIQWLDEMSLDILVSFVKFATQDFLLLLSRPVSESGSDMLQRLAKHPSIQKITLTGLTRQAVEEMIMKKFAHYGVPITGIEENLLDAIVEKGSRFPLFTSMIAVLLHDKLHKEVILSSDGTLKLANFVDGVDTILLSTVSAAIICQFDRLPYNYQGILRVASCIGQYFNLQDVLDVGGFALTPQQLRDIIKNNDRYKFLVLGNTIGSSNAMEDEPEESWSCSFHHISIMNTIYESLSYTERVPMNLKAARRLEEKLTSENEDMLLHLISFFYSRTTDYAKNIMYLEKLGCRYVEACAYAEGAQTLVKLDEFYQTLDEEAAAHIGSLRRGRWLAETAWAHAQVRNFKFATVTAMSAIDMISDTPWPRDEPGVLKRFQKSKRLLIKLWIATGGGRWPLPGTDKSKSVQKSKSILPMDIIDRERVIERCLFALAIVSSYDVTFMASMSELVIVEALCIVMTRAYKDYSSFRTYLARGRSLLHFRKRSLANVLGVRLARADRSGTPTQSHHFVYGILEFFLGSPLKKAAFFLESFGSWCQNRGDSPAHLACEVMLSWITMLRGEPLGTTEPYLHKLSNDPNYFDLVWTPGALLALYRKRLLEANFDETQQIISKLLPLSKLWLRNPVFLSQFQYLESYATLINGNMEESIRIFHQAITNSMHVDRFNSIDVMCSPGIFIWLFIDPEKSGLPRFVQHTAETKSQLFNALKDSYRLLMFLGEKNEIIQCWWTWHLIDAAIDILSGDAESGVKKLLNKLKYGGGILSKRKRKEVHDMKLFWGVYCAVISRYWEKQNEKKVYERLARDLFEKMGVKLFLKWLDMSE